MTAFVPALNKPLLHAKSTNQTPLSTTPSLSVATQSPLNNIRTHGYKHPPATPLVAPLAASLRDPASHHDGSHPSMPPKKNAIEKLIPHLFGQPSAQEDLANSDNELTQANAPQAGIFGVLASQSSEKNSNHLDANAIDTAYLDTIKHQAINVESEDANQSGAARLPIPSGLGNLFGRNEKQNSLLNTITLQMPWQRSLKDKEIMTLLKLGLLSRFVYQKLAQSHHETQVADFESELTKAGYKLKTISVGDNLWGLVAHRNNEVLVSFRGTAFWDDMWRNIQFWPSLDKTVPENECTHHGMSHVFEQLWPKIDETLSEIAKDTWRPLQVYTSGHSLGGSFAKLTALRLANKQKAGDANYKAQTRMVCTYGAPKTFFIPSAACYRERGLDHKTITITQHQDIVPELPPNFLSPYETVGNRLYITRDGSLWYKPESGCVDEDKFRETPEEAGGNGRPNRWVSDHVLDSYLLVLQAYSNAKLPKPLPPGSCPTTSEQMFKLKS